MVRTVPNTHFCCLYVKKIDEVIKIYQNCRVIQYSYTIFGSDAFIRHTILIFFTSKYKIKGSNSCWMQTFRSVKTDVKIYQTKYLAYAFTAI